MGHTPLLTKPLIGRGGVFLPLRHADLVDLNVPGPQCWSSEELCCVSILRRLGEGIYYHYIKRREFLPYSQDGRLILASHGHGMPLHVSAHACSLIHMCRSQDKQYSTEACFCSLLGMATIVSWWWLPSTLGLLNCSWSLSWLGIRKCVLFAYLLAYLFWDSLMYKKLALNLLCSWGWPWTSALLFLPSLGGIAGLHHHARLPVVLGMEHARQAFYQQGYIPSPWLGILQLLAMGLEG